MSALSQYIAAAQILGYRVERVHAAETESKPLRAYEIAYHSSGEVAGVYDHDGEVYILGIQAPLVRAIAMMEPGYESVYIDRDDGGVVRKLY